MTEPTTPDSGAMTAHGKRALLRRERLRATQDEVAEVADVNRDTVRAVEAGKASSRSLGKVEDALDEMEAEAGLPQWIDADVEDAAAQTEPHLIEFEVSGDFGVRVVVRGPVSDAEALERSVERIVANIRNSRPEEPGSTD